MDNQMPPQHTELFMKLQTVEHAIKANSTVALDQLKQANKIFDTFSNQVVPGLCSNTEKV